MNLQPEENVISAIRTPEDLSPVEPLISASDTERSHSKTTCEAGIIEASAIDEEVNVDPC